MMIYFGCMNDERNYSSRCFHGIYKTEASPIDAQSMESVDAIDVEIVKIGNE